MTACTQLQTRACVRTGVACRAAPRSRALRAAHATRRSSTPLRASERDGAPAGVLAEVADTSRLWQRGEWLCVPRPGCTRATSLRQRLPLTHPRSASRPRSFGAQALALLGVAAPPEQLDAFFAAAGVGSVVAGAAFALAGVRDLGASLSPFPVPSRDNALVTDGVYAMARVARTPSLFPCRVSPCALF